jgi:hypothetical protein
VTRVRVLEPDRPIRVQSTNAAHEPAVGVVLDRSKLDSTRWRLEMESRTPTQSR